MDGDTGVRLSDSGEGSLSRLFAEINGLATSLTSHIHNEKQSREFLKETISDISHQLKTPLAALRMYNDIIKEEKADGDTVDSFLSKSERELTRMETLIQNLLKLARLDAGTIGIEKSEHDLTDFLEDCAGGFLTRAELEGKRLSLRRGDAVISRFDWMWMKEAVCNIIKNALDHTENGDSVEISCAKNTVYTEITVIDTGSGIYKEDIHHIFKRFYRSRFSKDRQGIGIGLALSKAIVEKHGGTITVESEPGKGAAFHIILPNLSNL
jgi:signal transduction histidine kinase